MFSSTLLYCGVELDTVTLSDSCTWQSGVFCLYFGWRSHWKRLNHTELDPKRQTFTAAVHTALDFCVHQLQKFGFSRRALRCSSFWKVTISSCPASKLKVVLLSCAGNVQWRDLKWTTHGSIWSKGLKLFSNSCISRSSRGSVFLLLVTTDALSLRAFCTEGKCRTRFLCQSSEKMLIQSLDSSDHVCDFCSSHFRLFSFPVTSVEQAKVKQPFSVLQEWHVLFSAATTSLFHPKAPRNAAEVALCWAVCETTGHCVVHGQLL